MEKLMRIYTSNEELLLRILNNKSENFELSLEGIEMEFDKLIKWIIENSENSEKSKIFLNFLTAIVNYIKLAKNSNKSVILLAFCTRNIYEIYLISKCLSENKNNIQDWILEAHRDEDDIISSMHYFITSIVGDSNYLSNEIAALEKKQMEKKEFFDKNGLTLPKIRRMIDLANHLGERTDYNFFYKFLSKLLHPSSYLINSSKEEIQNDHNFNFLKLHIELFSLSVLKVIKNEMNFHEVSVQV